MSQSPDITNKEKLNYLINKVNQVAGRDVLNGKIIEDSEGLLISIKYGTITINPDSFYQRPQESQYNLLLHEAGHEYYQHKVRVDKFLTMYHDSYLKEGDIPKALSELKKIQEDLEILISGENEYRNNTYEGSPGYCLDALIKYKSELKKISEGFGQLETNSPPTIAQNIEVNISKAYKYLIEFRELSADRFAMITGDPEILKKELQITEKVSEFYPEDALRISHVEDFIAWKAKAEQQSRQR